MAKKKNATALAAQDLNQGHSKHVFMHKPLRQPPPPPKFGEEIPTIRQNNSAGLYGISAP